MPRTADTVRTSSEATVQVSVTVRLLCQGSESSRVCGAGQVLRDPLGFLAVAGVDRGGDLPPRHAAGFQVSDQRDLGHGRVTHEACTSPRMWASVLIRVVFHPLRIRSAPFDDSGSRTPLTMPHAPSSASWSASASVPSICQATLTGVR